MARSIACARYARCLPHHATRFGRAQPRPAILLPHSSFAAPEMVIVCVLRAGRVGIVEPIGSLESDGRGSPPRSSFWSRTTAAGAPPLIHAMTLENASLLEGRVGGKRVLLVEQETLQLLRGRPDDARRGDYNLLGELREIPGEGKVAVGRLLGNVSACVGLSELRRELDLGRREGDSDDYGRPRRDPDGLVAGCCPERFERGVSPRRFWRSRPPFLACAIISLSVCTGSLIKPRVRELVSVRKGGQLGTPRVSDTAPVLLGLSTEWEGWHGIFMQVVSFAGSSPQVASCCLMPCVGVKAGR